MPFGLLVVEDERTLASNIKRYMERGDYEVHLAHSAEDGLAEFDRFQPDIVLLDHQLGDGNGLDVLDRIRARDSRVKVVMMTAHGSTEIAVAAMKSGANDYLNKPLVLSELRMLIDRAVGQERMEQALDYLRRRAAPNDDLDAVIGHSPAMRALKDQIRQLLSAEREMAGDDSPAVLITGETGAGKGILAKAIHSNSARANSPLVEINCATLPANLIEAELFGYERGAFTDATARKIGLAEAAHGGTLFLDEIGDIELPLQAKLLRLLEDKTVRRLGSVRDQRVNIRVIAATNRPLEELIREKRFRSDLYFRLRIVSLHVPPLRERGQDIVVLAEHFLASLARRYGKPAMSLGDDALEALVAYNWPGNVRELRNVVEQAVLLAGSTVIHRRDLSLSPTLSETPMATATAAQPAMFVLPEAGVDLDKVERDLVRQAVERTDGNVTRAAKLLGLTRDTLRYRLDKYGLTRR